MILIADSGSTKTEWCLADQGRPVRTVVTAGTNPYQSLLPDTGGDRRRNPGCLIARLEG